MGAFSLEKKKLCWCPVWLWPTTMGQARARGQPIPRTVRATPSAKLLPKALSPLTIFVENAVLLTSSTCFNSMFNTCLFIYNSYSSDSSIRLSPLTPAHLSHLISLSYGSDENSQRKVLGFLFYLFTFSTRNWIKHYPSLFTAIGIYFILRNPVNYAFINTKHYQLFVSHKEGVRIKWHLDSTQNVPLEENPNMLFPIALMMMFGQGIYLQDENCLPITENGVAWQEFISQSRRGSLSPLNHIYAGGLDVVTKWKNTAPAQ